MVGLQTAKLVFLTLLALLVMVLIFSQRSCGMSYTDHTKGHSGLAILVFLAFLALLVVVFNFFQPSCNLSPFSYGTLMAPSPLIPYELAGHAGLAGFADGDFSLFFIVSVLRTVYAKYISSPINTAAILFTTKVRAILLLVVRETTA